MTVRLSIRCLRESNSFHQIVWINVISCNRLSVATFHVFEGVTESGNFGTLDGNVESVNGIPNLLDRNWKYG